MKKFYSVAVVFDMLSKKFKLRANILTTLKLSILIYIFSFKMVNKSTQLKLVHFIKNFSYYSKLEISCKNVGM